MHPRPSSLSSPRRFFGVLAVIAVVAGACSGQATGSPTSTGTTTVGPSSAATPRTSAPTAVATPAATALPALKVLWQGARPGAGAVATYWPAIDPLTGNIWVAAAWENKFWIFKPDGTFVEAWGTAGSGDGQFKLTTNDPHPDSTGAIAFAPDGTFYVADNGNYRVEKFSKDRKFLAKWGSFGAGVGQFGSPKGIATDGKTVWVADDAQQSLQAFDTSGKFESLGAWGFVLFSRAASGSFFVADWNGVVEVDPTGTTVQHTPANWTALGGDPSDVVSDGKGHLFAGIQGRSGPKALVELDASAGTVLGEWSNGAETMAIAPDGKTLYLAYTGPGTQNGLGWPYIQAVALP